jgi:hypothetical protein
MYKAVLHAGNLYYVRSSTCYSNTVINEVRGVLGYVTVVMCLLLQLKDVYCQLIVLQRVLQAL